MITHPRIMEEKGGEGTEVTVAKAVVMADTVAEVDVAVIEVGVAEGEAVTSPEEEEEEGE